MSNYNDDYLYILFQNLTQDNIYIMEDLIQYDSRYYYSDEYNKYGIRVKDINDNSSYELQDLTSVLVNQKQYKKILVN